MVDPLVLLAILVLIAFAPPVAYVLWIRNSERHDREPLGQVAKMFAWGAIGGVILGIIFSLLLSRSVFLGPLAFVGSAALINAISATVIAPLAEEPAKALALPWVKDPYPEPEDGFVYGAAAGLGFAATETLFYVSDAYASGTITGAVVTGILRAFSSAFLHGTTSALVGYGYLRRRSILGALPFLLVAIVVHAAYNGLLSAAVWANEMGAVTMGSLALNLLGFVLAIAIAVSGWRIVRKRVRHLDRRSAPR